VTIYFLVSQTHIFSDLSISALIVPLLLLQLPAVAILLSRLILGPFRIPPIEPQVATLETVGFGDCGSADVK
jgi:dolichol-phosphate mannosyltransferase